MNTRNQFEFNLQHAGVEAIVERGHFYLEGSPTPRFQLQLYYDGDKPLSDAFLFNGHQYAAKQPGQFMAGAIIYYFLRLFGLSYLNIYFLTSSLVSFFTTSLMTAVAAIAVLVLVREFTSGHTRVYPPAAGVIYALGTVAFPYSGIAHHDGLASAYLAIAFCVAVLLARRKWRGQSVKILAGICGLLLGFTITTSMLPFFMACAAGLYVVSLRRWNVTAMLLLGAAVGVAPLLFFNWMSFGNPFLNSYMAGGYPESMLHFNLQNSLAKTRFYLSEITLYVPVAWLGILGLAFFPRELRREQLALLGLLLAQAFQVLNIESHGGCHYGPRFLLPVMPFCCIGLAGFHYLRHKLARVIAISLVGLTAAFSIFVNSAGAVFTVMYCDIEKYALWPALKAIRGGAWRDLPLAKWLLLPILISLGLLIYSIKKYPARSVPEVV